MPPFAPHCVSDVLVTQTLPLQQPAHVLGPHEELVSGGPASVAPPPELLELPKPPLLPLDDDSVLPEELPLPPDDELPLPDDPVEELWLAGPPSSPPSREP
jgi:hypothetical protein